MPSSVSQPRLPERKRHGTRQLAILAAAHELMVEQGVAQVSVRAVARAAGISPGNLGYYFPTHSDLLDALLHWVLEPYLETFARLRAAAEGNPLAALRAVLSYVLDDLGTKNTTMFFPELWVLANRDDAAAKHMCGLYDAYIEVLEELIAAARPDLSRRAIADLALFVCASIEGQTVFIGHNRPHTKRRAALKKLTLDTMVAAVRNR